MTIATKLSKACLRISWKRRNLNRLTLSMRTLSATDAVWHQLKESVTCAQSVQISISAKIVNVMVFMLVTARGLRQRHPLVGFYFYIDDLTGQATGKRRHVLQRLRAAGADLAGCLAADRTGQARGGLRPGLDDPPSQCGETAQ